MTILSTVVLPHCELIAYFEIFAFEVDRTNEIAYINANLPALSAREATPEEVAQVQAWCSGPTEIISVEELEETAYEKVRGKGALPAHCSTAQVYDDGTWNISRISW